MGVGCLGLVCMGAVVTLVTACQRCCSFCGFDGKNPQSSVHVAGGEVPVHFKVVVSEEYEVVDVERPPRIERSRCLR